jgi:thymidylate synthase (FAD)
MILIKPSVKILMIMGNDPLELIETAGRTCYQSNKEGETVKFVQKLIKLGHHSVIEHSAMAVGFTVDRGVSHELVRHRLCAFSQESTRYCKYKDNVTFIIPPWCNISPGIYNEADMTNDCPDSIWFNSMIYSEFEYKKLLSDGWSPQQARSVLPNSLKTNIVVTANLREWLHILTLRTSSKAHPQMREVMLSLLDQVKSIIPIIFDSVLDHDE